ncbi:hypothetical protein LGV61_02495 [Desulfurispirillum indicum]|nr:hypothetical protein [Desulfurispirillum indicum]UCZ57166.1 hypothetical protein LGV61_02495 [Desulfurispirillum indicum]
MSTANRRETRIILQDSRVFVFIRGKSGCYSRSLPFLGAFVAFVAFV